MIARPFTLAVLLIAVMGCEKETQQQPPTSEKASGGEVAYKDPGTPVASDAEEGKSLVYWYDSRNKQLNVFDQPALEQLMEEGIAKEIRWTPGQVVAQVLPGPGLPAVQAQVAAFSAIDTPPDAIYASVGDMRRLKAYRERFTMRENRSACLTDLRFAPIWQPAGRWRMSSRAATTSICSTRARSRRPSSSRTPCVIRTIRPRIRSPANSIRPPMIAGRNG
jgi:hypothetical protein